MFRSLAQSKTGAELELVSIENGILKDKLEKVGLYPGDRINKIINDPDMRAVRVKIENREFILSGAMASGVVVHLDDGRKIPLCEMNKGETGHMEGKTGCEELEKLFHALNIRDNDDLTLVRKLPPMTYSVVVKGSGRRKLPDSIVAKILGFSEGKMIQFSAIHMGRDFQVHETLCTTEEEKEYLENCNIIQGTVINIESVEPEMALHFEGEQESLCIAKDDGLRVYLSLDNCEHILVRETV